MGEAAGVVGRCSDAVVRTIVAMRSLRTRSRMRALAAWLLLAGGLLLVSRASAQIDRPWEHPNGPGCFELWFATVLSRLNAHEGGAGFNAQKPFRVSPWGLILASNAGQDRAPDDWGQHGGNKYRWAWAHAVAGPLWASNEWNSARVPFLQPFVLACIAQGEAGGAGAGATTGRTGTSAPAAAVTTPAPPTRASAPPAPKGGPSAAGGQAWEPGVNRFGSDYRGFVLGPELCREACDREPQCRAWTFVKPGVQGEHARCWLKSSVPTATRNSCCVSGVKQGG